MSVFCGIDFGTTNTVVSICDKRGELIDSFSVPTILFIPSESQGISKVFIGEEAKEAYEAGKKGRYIHSIKRSLSDPYLRHTRINRTYVKLERLIYFFLMELKKIIFEKWCISPQNIVLGRPVKFSLNEEHDRMANERLLESFALAGFKQIIQLEEPVAASLCFDEAFQEKDKVFMIMDLGGGTSDFSLVERDPFKEGIKKYKVLSIEGINIGGDNFDEDIMYHSLSPLLGIDATFESFGKRLPMPIHIYKEICRWNTMHLMDRTKMKEEFHDYLYRSDDPVAIHRLRAVIENKFSHKLLEKVRECKHNLSQNPNDAIRFNELNMGIDCKISAEKMGVFLNPQVEDIMKILKKTLEPEISIHSIDKVILTGGSSRVAHINEKTKEIISEHKILKDSNFYNSVSKGLALYAHHSEIQCSEQ